MAKRRVLVVEDNIGTRTMLEDALGFEGFQVTSLPDGRSVMDRLRAGKYDVVVLDVMMPGRTGVEILRDIRDDDATRRTPVIMLTALDDPQATWNGWTAGCDYYMTKPFDTQVLVDVIGRVLEAAA